MSAERARVSILTESVHLFYFIFVITLYKIIKGFQLIANHFYILLQFSSHFVEEVEQKHK